MQIILCETTAKGIYKMNPNCIIFLSANGYKISDINGNILFDNQSYASPDDAIKVAESNNYTWQLV